MEHEYITQHALTVRYVTGDLAETERDAFEAHLAGCAVCAGEVEAAQNFRDGMRALGVEARPKPVRVFHPAWAAAAVLLIACGWLALRLHQSNGQLETLTARASVPPPPADTAVANGPVFNLVLTRGNTSTESPNRVTVPEGARWVILSVDAAGLPEKGTYLAYLEDRDRKRAWIQPDQAITSRDSLGIAVPTVALNEPDMTLVIEAELPQGTWGVIGRYPFRVIRPGPIR